MRTACDSGGAGRRIHPELRQMCEQRGEPPDHLVEPTVQPDRQRPGDLAPGAALPDALQQERHDLGETHGQGVRRGLGHGPHKSMEALKKG